MSSTPPSGDSPVDPAEDRAGDRMGAPPDGAGTDARAPHAMRMDELSAVIDRVVEADRELAVIAACRAELIDQARALSLADATATAEERGGPMYVVGSSGWSPSVIAHRELIAELACA